MYIYICSYIGMFFGLLLAHIDHILNRFVSFTKFGVWALHPLKISRNYVRNLWPKAQLIFKTILVKDKHKHIEQQTFAGK